MTDIVERLRGYAEANRDDGFHAEAAVADEAADEIERLRGIEQDAVEWVEERTKRLRADNARLRAALDEINMASFPLTGSIWCVPIGAWDNAMRALEANDG